MDVTATAREDVGEYGRTIEVSVTGVVSADQAADLIPGMVQAVAQVEAVDREVARLAQAAQVERRRSEVPDVG